MTPRPSPSPTLAEPLAVCATPSPDAQFPPASTALARGLGMLAIVCSAACWGLATVATKGALETLPPFFILAVQLTASVSFLWTAVCLSGASLRGVRGGGIALSGLLEPGLAYGVGVPGLALTSAANASVISTVEPALICAIAWLLLRDRPSRTVAAALVLAMAGVALVTVSGAEANWATDGSASAGGHLAGDALILLGTLFAALYVVVSSRLVGHLAPLPLAALQQSVGLAFALVLLLGVWTLGIETLPQTLPLETLLLVAGSGIVQYALAVWLYLTGLSVLPPAVAGLFLTLIPVFGVSGAMIFLGEAVAPLQWVGGGLVILAVSAVIRGRRPA